MKRKRTLTLGALVSGALALSLLLGPAPLRAGQVEIVKAELLPLGGNRYRVTVTLRHEDEGRMHYADRWEIVGPKGHVLGVRRLTHPHVNEQPFTRSLDSVVIRSGITEVTVRARDNRHGYSRRELKLKVPR